MIKLFSLKTVAINPKANSEFMLKVTLEKLKTKRFHVRTKIFRISLTSISLVQPIPVSAHTNCMVDLLKSDAWRHKGRLKQGRNYTSQNP
jgi:hypothetical protein